MRLRLSIQAPLRLALAGAVLFGRSGLPAAAEPSADQAGAIVAFNRDIREVQSENGVQCYGPDKGRREAELRLDAEAGAQADRGGRRAIVPADVERSELFERQVADDATERMPPVPSGKHLTAAPIETNSQWIAHGAKWQKHWSFLAPISVAPPTVKEASRVNKPINAFVLARRERLPPAPRPG